MREKIRKEVLSLDKKELLLKCATGLGKTKLALDIMVKLNPGTILVVVPQTVLKANWKNEFKKFGLEEWLDKVKFICYDSIKHYIGKYDLAIFDEGHHITPLVAESLIKIEAKNTVLLSATVSIEKMIILRSVYKDLYVYSKTLKEAIDADVLPEPNVYLIPLKLNSKDENYVYIEHPKATKIKHCKYTERWNFLKDKDIQLHVHCSEYQYYCEINDKIAYYKRMAMKNNSLILKNKWLFKCSERLRFLAKLKNSVVLSLQDQLKQSKILTFCADIEQAKELGVNCIHCKNKNNAELIDKFNNDEIKHLTAVDMLNEGITLHNLEIGIFAILNSSERLIIQKLGRVLRHESPSIYIPYFVGTREEEILELMIENYNPDYIHIL